MWVPGHTDIKGNKKVTTIIMEQVTSTFYRPTILQHKDNIL